MDKADWVADLADLLRQQQMVQGAINFVTNKIRRIEMEEALKAKKVDKDE